MLGKTTLPNDVLRAFARTLKSVGLTGVIIYVLLSLGSALAGSLVAVFLVPLVQPGHTLPLGGGLFDVQGGIDLHSAVFAGTAIAFALLRWQAARLGARLVGRYGMNLRCMVHAQLIDAPLASLADATSAEIANVLTHNIEIVTQGFNALLQLLVVGVTSIVSVGFALWVSPPLVFVAPLLAGFGLMASRISSREQSLVSRQYVSDLTRLFWHSEDFPRRLRHVRSFEKEEAEKDGYGAISERLGYGYQRQLELIASGRLMLELLAAVGIAAVFMLAYRLHGVDQASLIAVCLLLGRLLPYLVSTRQSFQQLRSAVPAFELWRRYMYLQPTRSSAAPPGAVASGDVLYVEHIRLMPPLDALDIDELVLMPGELTLISGDSGIGKSSLVDVLAGMATPKEFSARIDGQSIDFDTYCQLVRRGAYVSQSVRPWQRSIRECLLWAAPGATDEMLTSALEDVGLAKRLAASRRGLDSAIDNASSKLSGGELQRLLLAQVILRQPRVALLDEATSALDVASEIMVLSQLKHRLPHTILIVVSHRPDVMAIADQRLVIGEDLSVVASVA
ncbi:ABC transporter ATP-binding protein [Dyella lipolytica]|uniref:ABC transporter ATP-binding protein n=1 Tax=Dyella lipolytica TaxID=1867835 RepID=A0ABW8ISE0_9GAMM|nr:ABC transporter ATP-binding protein [Dyella lipolytica]GLQ47131.1 ABC transporter ATP-binding protein [Dyella lipolytica]